MRHLFEDWDEVIQRIRAARKVGLFLNFDGTLVKFRPRPDQVSLETPLRNTLASLAENPRFRVTVISGRRQADLQSRISLPAVKYLGLHGTEGRAGVNAKPESRHALRVVGDLLRDVLGHCPGAWLEDKRDILSIHYRGVEEPGRVEQLVRGMAGRFSKWIRVTRGKKVWELVPHELEDKGDAVRHELRSQGWLTLPFYIGDDAGDEPAFEALYRGVTVRVGRARKSHARYRLTNVEQVRMVLERLQAEC